MKRALMLAGAPHEGITTSCMHAQPLPCRHACANSCKIHRRSGTLEVGLALVDLVSRTLGVRDAPTTQRRLRCFLMSNAGIDMLLLQNLEILLGFAAPLLTAMASKVASHGEYAPTSASTCADTWDTLLAKGMVLGSATMAGAMLLTMGRGIPISVHGNLMREAHCYLRTPSPSVSHMEQYQDAVWEQPAGKRYICSYALFAGVVTGLGKMLLRPSLPWLLLLHAAYAYQCSSAFRGVFVAGICAVTSWVYVVAVVAAESAVAPRLF